VDSWHLLLSCMFMDWLKMRFWLHWAVFAVAPCVLLMTRVEPILAYFLEWVIPSRKGNSEFHNLQLAQRRALNEFPFRPALNRGGIFKESWSFGNLCRGDVWKWMDFGKMGPWWFKKSFLNRALWSFPPVCTLLSLHCHSLVVKRSHYAV